MPKLATRTLTASSALLALSLVTGCKTIPTIETIPDVCLIWTPATYSASKDSPETVEGNRSLNAKRDDYCGAS